MEIIGVLGCGWLGFPLAEQLVKTGYLVNGSTTSPEKIIALQQKGIKPFLLKISGSQIEEGSLSSFLDVDALILNIPPSLRKNPSGYHLNQVQKIIDNFPSRLKKVVYISSTSVYPENHEVANEESAVLENHEIIKVERLLQQRFANNLTILRCGGLMGYDRVPGKYFAGKKALPEGNNPVNYVHRDDVIQIILHILKHDVFGELFNVVSPQHPEKKFVAIKTAEKFNLPLPEFKEEKARGFKVVDSQKLIQRLKYQFLFPDPLSFYYQYKP